jgi:cellulose synthase/poly-beta-1,6-N-acetylglucosamine synthase-like glycosyltransferase
MTQPDPERLDRVSPDRTSQDRASLDQALRRASPRYTRPPTPVASWLIHGGLATLFVLLVLRALSVRSVFAWSAGLVYVLYDTGLLVFTFVQTLPLLHKGAAAAYATRPRLAVLIAAHNEAQVLPATLRALIGQSDPPDRILVVDDGSTDRTGDVLAAFGLTPPALGAVSGAGGIGWLRLPHGGKAAALNRALGYVDAEIVLTVDADTRLDREAIGVMRAAFAGNADLVAATGILTPVCDETWLGGALGWFQRHEYLRNFLGRAAWMRQDGLLLISGAFAGFRRAAVLEVGGFDPDCLVEDYELIHRLRRHGARLGLGWTTSVLGRARAVTDAPSTIGGFLRQRRRWFGGFLQTQFWYRDMVGNSDYGRLGTLMLPVKAIDTLQPIYGLVALVLLAVFLGTGHLGVLAAAGSVIGVKLLVDVAFYLWSVLLYRRWVGTSGAITLGSALTAALLEPFSFQILRHLGACLGWVSVLTGQMRWGRSVRQAVLF